MNILLSNDDGFSAPGINSLYNLISSEHNVTMIAPHTEKSTTGHSLTLHRPLRLFQHDENRFSVDGFPADCTLMGLGHVFKDKMPDLVLSGINYGANLAQDLYYSGTLGAAREASFHKIPAIAVSLVFKKDIGDLHFNTASVFIKKLIDSGAHKYLEPNHLLNVNVPNIPISEVKGVEIGSIGKKMYSFEMNERVDTRGKNYYWIEGQLSGHEDIPGSDCNLVDEGKIAVTIHDLLQRRTQNHDKISQCIRNICL